MYRTTAISLPRRQRLLPMLSAIRLLVLLP